MEINLNDSLSLMGRMGLILEYDDNLTHQVSIPPEETIEEMIEEGVHKSQDADDMFRILKKHYDIDYESVFLETGHEIGVWVDTYRLSPQQRGSGEISIMSLVVPKDFQDKEKIKKFFEICGWSQGEVEFEYEKDKRYIVLPFEKNRQYEPVDVGKFVYHLTPTPKVEKIKKNGLTPRSGNKKGFNHVERIYLFTYKPNLLQSHLFAHDLWYSTLEQQTLDKDKISDAINGIQMPKYALLEIDVEKCGNIKFYGDPNLYKAVWTFDNIPPEAIKILNERI